MYTLLSASSTNTVIKTTYVNLELAQVMKAQVIALKKEAGLPYTVKLIDQLGNEIK